MFEKYIIERKRLRGTAIYVWVILKRTFIFWYKPLTYQQAAANRSGKKVRKTLSFRTEDQAIQELEKIYEKGEIREKAVKIEFGASQTMWVQRG